MQTISKSNRYARQREKRRELGRIGGLRSQQVQQAKRAQRDPDFATLRARALHDARGQVVREGCTYTAKGERHWRIVRSVAGRTDQYDVVIDGRVWRTGGQRRVKRWMGRSR